MNYYSNEELFKRKEEFSLVMLIDKLKNVADYAEIGQELCEEYLNEVTEKSPEYLLDIVAQIAEILLVKLNVPDEDVELFTGKIRERKMGELLANFEAWDVQEIRREAREKGIEKMIQALKAVVNSQVVAKQQLMEQYELNEEEADKRIELYW